jgi:hypothetical protein
LKYNYWYDLRQYHFFCNFQNAGTTAEEFYVATLKVLSRRKIHPQTGTDTQDKEEYKADDLHQAIELTMEWEDKIPIGIIYRKETRSYTDELAPLQSGPLFKQTYDPKKIQKAILAA